MKEIVLALIIGLLVGISGSYNGLDAFGFPIFALCVAFAFILQWVAFIPAYLFKTERFYDLVGSITFLLVITLAFFGGHPYDLRSMLLALFVAVWALRLGSFLFLRVMRRGEDRRFEEMKKRWDRFLIAWTWQGLWVSFTAAPALAAMTAIKTVPLDFFAFFGAAVWLAGFLFEAIADEQKRRHNKNRKGSFISTGLWRFSRHPNYFGEVVLWIGIAIISYPVLVGWQQVLMLSPLFVYLLITKISGIPLLEARADEKWGNDPEYQQYKKQTPLFFPFPQ